MWVGTHSGLNYRPKGSNSFTRYYYNSTEGQRISNNEIFAIQEDASGKIWIGTGGGGVDCYDPNTKRFTNLSPKNGLAGYNVYGILVGDNGNLWFSTDNGLSRYHPNEKTFRNYTLEVIGSNNDGLWSNTPTKLSIIVRPPFWRTWYAYLFYLLVIAAISWFIRKEINDRKALKNQLLLERVQRENEEKLHQMKLQFFTNISHDFQTPLTLILSPLENILSQENFAPKTIEHLTMVQRNAKRLRRLIDQLLDFRKLEFNKAVYTPVRTDMIDLCQDICQDLEVYARDKAISFSFESALSKFEIEFDPDKLDKVIFNLLSNAFKYTQENGTICLSVEEKNASELASDFDYATDLFPTGKVITVCVKDNGPGIEKDALPLVFERFYQTGNGQKQGTGIGLHLCREYVRMHKGTILVKSSPESGTTFTVLIPIKMKVSRLPNKR